MPRNILVSLFFFQFHFSIYSQRFISDSLMVQFGENNVEKIHASIDTIIDHRNTKPNCISISEKIKYIYVPIDYRILITKPLSVNLHDLFTNSSDSTKYRLEIKEFNIHTKPNLFQNNYSLNSIIAIYSVENKIDTYEGTLVYENNSEIWKNSKQPQKEYESFVDSWKKDFIKDMNVIVKNTSNDFAYKCPNLIKQQSGFDKNMLLSTDIAIGRDSWIIDGEIMFSGPEPKREFRREGNLLRYRHDKRYEAIEFSIVNKQFNYRINDQFVFIAKPKLFWGLNNWNENEYRKHGFEDILLLDCSVSQTLLFNPFYKKSIIFGVGVMENVNYIYSEPANFNLYFMFQLGIKL